MHTGYQSGKHQIDIIAVIISRFPVVHGQFVHQICRVYDILGCICQVFNIGIDLICNFQICANGIIDCCMF